MRMVIDNLDPETVVRRANMVQVQWKPGQWRFYRRRLWNVLHGGILKHEIRFGPLMIWTWRIPTEAGEGDNLI